MPKQTTFDANGPANAKVIVPENNLAADSVGRDTADVKIEMDNATPSVADPKQQ